MGNRALHEPASRPAGYEVIIRNINSLKGAFLEERQAIDNFDQDLLRTAGDRIAVIFQELTEQMETISSFPADQVSQAARLLAEARLLREENSRLLLELYHSTGSRIKTGAAGKQALRSYHHEKPEALFLKKNC